MRRYLAIPLPLRIGLLASIGFLLVLVAAPANADSEARQGADWVRITANACADAKVVAQITAAGENPQDFRAASAFFGGVLYTACWRPVFNVRQVHVVYEDGDQGLVPFGDLKPVRQV